VGVPIADLSAGLYTAIGIMVALLEREESGEGQWVHTSLLEAQIAMLDFQAARWTMKGDIPPQAGNNHPTSIPTGVFATSDGHINIATTGDRMFIAMCKVLDAPGMGDDKRYASGPKRSENRDALNADIEAKTRSNSTAHWVETMNAAGVPCGPIYNMDQVFADPQVQHLGMTASMNHPDIGTFDIVRNCVNLSRGSKEPYTITPERGEHTAEVLDEFGFSVEEIEALRRSGAI
jgi:formyl-CoA transferase